MPGSPPPVASRTTLYSIPVPFRGLAPSHPPAKCTRMPRDHDAATRVGIGYDSHRFAPGRPLILGGVQIPSEVGLLGHSDADAICHAITDAILGAAGLGDIGEMFP